LWFEKKSEKHQRIEMIRRSILGIALSIFSTIIVNAASIKGWLLNEENEPLIGAHVVVKGSSIYAIVGLDGSFAINNLEKGEYLLEASYIGYVSETFSVTINGNHEIVKMDVKLKADEKMLEDIIVYGKAEQGSDQESRQTIKQSGYVVNAVSAKTIDLSPDLTVANVAQRISGVSLVRNSNGDPQYAIIRGMDKRYNYTLVNGVKIPSPDNKNRYIPLDIFPSQLLERLEVSKTLTPNMEGDAIGGAVNMVMKNAPEERKISGDFQMGYSQIFLKKQDYLSFDKTAIDYETPSEKYGSFYQAQPSDFSTQNLVITPEKPAPDILGSLSYGDRFFNKKLGVLVAGTFQNSYKGTKSVWFQTATDELGNNSPTFNELHERTYSAQQTRYAGHLKLDYTFNKRNNISLYSGSYRLINNETRDMTVSQLDARFYDAEKGNVILSFDTRTRIIDQHINSTNLSGDHRLTDAFRIKWTGVYSKAKGEEPDNSSFERNSGLTNFVQAPETVERYMPRRWERSTDQDYTGYLNFIFTPQFIGNGNEISIGGMYRNKERENYYNRYTFDPDPPTQQRGKEWNDFSDVKLEVLNPLGSFDERNYSAHENLLDGYVQGKFLLFGNMQLLGGVRVENTDQGYALKYPKDGVEPSLSQIYTDVLPSLNVKYMPNDRMNVRGSYYKAISRPGYFEIVPYKDDNTEGFKEYGNPNLKRAHAHNLDLRWEYFPNTFDQLLAGVFYKKILDPIEYAAVLTDGGTTSTVVQPGNYGTANNWGIELDVTKYFNKFGIKANYTFTSSSVTTTKRYRTREDPNDNTSQIITLFPNQTRPLQGQARNIANLSVLYKDQKTGTNLQLAYVYTGERIESLSPYLDNDTWQKPILQMDFSGEQKLGSHLILFVKIRNILNSPYSLVIKKPHLYPEKEYKLQNSSKTTLVRHDEYYQNYRIGIRFNF
jgi:outer membrane receptor protein involved in Fe transport